MGEGLTLLDQEELCFVRIIGEGRRRKHGET